MADPFLYDVFLSHSAKDKAVVRDVAERLRKDGVKVWFDEWVLKPGDSIPKKESDRESPVVREFETITNALELTNDIRTQCSHPDRSFLQPIYHYDK